MTKIMERRTPHMSLAKEQIQGCIDSLGSAVKVKEFVLASSGLANTNYIVTLENGEKVILRIHSNTKSEKGLMEFKLSKLLASFSEVPKVLYFQPAGQADFSYSIIEFIDGITLPEINAKKEELTDAYFEIGAMLAQLRSIKFKSAGLLDKNLDVVTIKTKTTMHHPVTNFVLDCLENPNLIKRTGIQLKDAIQKLILEQDPLLFATDEENHLVHGDFKIENIMIKDTNGKIHLSGVLDWEHARSDSSYGDMATLFRGDYDKSSSLKQAFSEGFKSKDTNLIQDWDKANKLIDLVNICSFLCSSSNRPTLHEIMINHLQNTINYFKRE